VFPLQNRHPHTFLFVSPPKGTTAAPCGFMYSLGDSGHLTNGGCALSFSVNADAEQLLQSSLMTSQHSRPESQLPPPLPSQLTSQHPNTFPSFLSQETHHVLQQAQALLAETSLLQEDQKLMYQRLQLATNHLFSLLGNTVKQLLYNIRFLSTTPQSIECIIIHILKLREQDTNLDYIIATFFPLVCRDISLSIADYIYSV